MGVSISIMHKTIRILQKIVLPIRRLYIPIKAFSKIIVLNSAAGGISFDLINNYLNYQMWHEGHVGWISRPSTGHSLLWAMHAIVTCCTMHLLWGFDIVKSFFYKVASHLTRHNFKQQLLNPLQKPLLQRCEITYNRFVEHLCT